MRFKYTNQGFSVTRLWLREAIYCKEKYFRYQLSLKPSQKQNKISFNLINRRDSVWVEFSSPVFLIVSNLQWIFVYTLVKDDLAINLIDEEIWDTKIV